MKTKLVGSTPSLETMLEHLENNYFFSKIEISESDKPGHYTLANSKGIIEGFRIIKKKNRFRLERMLT